MKLIERSLYIAGLICIGMGLGVKLMNGQADSIRRRDRKKLDRTKAQAAKRLADAKRKNAKAAK